MAEVEEPDRATAVVADRRLEDFGRLVDPVGFEEAAAEMPLDVGKGRVESAGALEPFGGLGIAPLLHGVKPQPIPPLSRLWMPLEMGPPERRRGLPVARPEKPVNISAASVAASAVDCGREGWRATVQSTSVCASSTKPA